MLFQFTVTVHPQYESHEEARVLGDQRPQGYAFYLHIEEIDKAEAGDDVHDVLCNGYVHGNARVLHADIPSGEAV